MNDLLLWLQAGFFLAALVAVYFYWIRPVIRERPRLKEFYDGADTFWGAVNLKFQGIKGALATAIAKAAAVVVYLHDQVIPYVANVDWTPLTAKVPGWAWPIVLFCAFWFIGKAREWAEQR